MQMYCVESNKSDVIPIDFAQTNKRERENKGERKTKGVGMVRDDAPNATIPKWIHEPRSSLEK